jgi:hypothetical protein
MLDQVGVPFYTDIKFWSLVISIAALLLSQWKFFANLFRRASLSVEPYSQAYLTHRFGWTSAQLHMTLINSGGRKVRIKGVAMRISSASENTFTIPVTGYFQKQSDTQTMLFRPFTLQPGEEWAHIAQFYQLLPRQEDKFIRQAISTLRADVLEKVAQRPKELEHQVVYAEECNVAPILDFFEKQFKWSAEEYRLTLSIDTEPPSVVKDQQFRFVLFESDIAEMRRIVKKYCTGEGVYFPPELLDGVHVPLEKIN